MATELGEFLRSRRAAITPADAGLTSYGARRVPGLRREELAQLAGVSPTYYTRLEQSAQHNASDGVIDALARALALTPSEHEHLRRLARPAAPVPARRPFREKPRTSALGLVDSLPGPAFLLDHCNDVLAWNRIGHALLGGSTPYDAPSDVRARPNLIRMFFRCEDHRSLFVDDEQQARALVAYLRYSSGRHPDDPRLTALIGELCRTSDDFARLWASHVVKDCGFGVKRYQHPLVGRVDLPYETMQLSESTHRLAIYHAEPGTPAGDALELLARR